MTPTEWIAARRAMLARATKGRWTRPKSILTDAAVGYEYGKYRGIHVEADRATDADLIVAAVNEQEAVVRLVEAVEAYRLNGYDTAEDLMFQALAALVGETKEV